MKSTSKDTQNLEKEIEFLKSKIEDRKLDKLYSDSFEQSDQISKDIENMESKLTTLVEVLEKCHSLTKQMGKLGIERNYKNLKKSPS